jgi:Putative lumazine-binding
MSDVITKIDEHASFEAYNAIAVTLQRYIDGARTGDGALMRTVFLETAHIRGSYGGQGIDWALSDFCALIDKHGPAADIVAHLVTLDVSGTAAAARLEAENWRGTRYSDFFLLLRVDGGWRIASKVFFAHSRA